MKNLVYGESSWLVGDDAANAILEYTVLMAKDGAADTVDVNVLGPDGNSEMTTLVLGPATMIQAQTTRSQLQEPENFELIVYIRERLRSSTLPAQPLSSAPLEPPYADEI